MNASLRRRLVIGATVLALCAPASVTVNVAHALPTIDAADAPGCAGERDTRHPNIGVELDVTGPDEIDVTKDMTFKLKGTGIHPKSTPGASNGMYVVLTPTSVWRIGHCSTLPVTEMVSSPLRMRSMEILVASTGEAMEMSKPSVS